MKNCLVVLGMHRSGTSALTGVLEQLGVDLGDRLMDPAPDNPGGFFENTVVVDTNEAILEAIGSSWDDPFRLPTNWQDKAPGGQLRSEAGNFLSETIGQDRLCALKDPRLSRLLPWWQGLLDADQVTARYAILVRNPLEVAASLAARNRFSTPHSLLLWMQHMLEAERHTRGRHRAFVHYDDLLLDPPGTVRKLYESCELPAPANIDQALAGFIDTGKRHHALGQDAVDDACPALVSELYSHLLHLARTAPAASQDATAIEDIDARFRQGQRLYHTPELARAVSDRRRLPDNLDDFLRSPPWRLYRGYQHAIYRFLPEGTPLRRFLQRVKNTLLGAPQ